ncbi:MAG: hypothetical protein ACYC9K_01115 [Sulfuricaulis sp.]
MGVCNRKWPAKLCSYCYVDSHRIYKKTYGSDQARNAVTKAIKNGLLSPIKGQSCVDCGNSATEYDHRDYNKPIDVVPVCHRCNVLRGPAIPLETALEAA